MKQAPWRQLVALLAVAFVVRLSAGWVWQSRLEGRFAMGDSESYWQLGQAIAHGQPYEYGLQHARVFRTPGYPILLTPIFWLAGDGRAALLLARAEAARFGTLAVLGVWWLTRLLFDGKAALIAAIVAAFYPGAIMLSVLILSEAPFCPLMLLNLALWIIASRAPSLGRRTALSVSAGLAAGAATLLRPSWLLFAPFAAAVGTAVGNRGSRLRHLMISCWMIVGLVVAMLPWWIRNALVTGRFVPTTLQIGASLYDGLNPKAMGASNMDFVPEFIEQETQHRKASPSAELLEIRPGSSHARRGDSLGVGQSRPGRSPCGAQVSADVEHLAERAAVLRLVHPADRPFHVYSAANICDNRWLENGPPRLALCIVLVADPVLDIAALGICQFASIPRAGHASTDGDSSRRD